MAPGGIALRWAVREWAQVVREPTPAKANGAARIDSYIRSPMGLAWPSAALADSTDSRAYTRNGQFEWCGAFVARAWGEAGCDEQVRRKRLASTSRLRSTSASMGRPLLRVALDALEPGDILVVTDGRASKPAGTHITLVQSVADGLAYTIEGNARGKLGDATVGEGVIMRTRPMVKPADRSAVCPVSALPQLLWAHLAYRPTPAMLYADSEV